MAEAARAAAQQVLRIDTAVINQALQTVASLLLQDKAAIIEANQKDLAAANKKNMAASFIDRLMMDDARLEGLAASVRSIAALPDPVHQILETTKRPNGLQIDKVSVPIGVLGMIYESRPNVTIDAAALCLKSRNGVILRGGSDSFHTARALFTLFLRALQKHDLPTALIQMPETTDRRFVDEMLKTRDAIDVLIPRGGKNLTERVMNEAVMPVFAHLDGNCHFYWHGSADSAMAQAVILNAKLRRTGICGALESLLIDRAVAPDAMTAVLQALHDDGCRIRGDKDICAIFTGAEPATEADWHTEYLDKILSVKMVNGVEDAAAHINHYGSHHTDGILSDDEETVRYFQTAVDSAIVVHNASTQFADGGEFGMGAEIGIGTGKLHARGPVGLNQLCTFKYIVRGTGQTRPV